MFTPYQKFVVALLAFLQFTVVLDFMILSPLGPILMPALSIQPEQFGLVVSAYAFSAGVSGLLSAGFADRFDRKRLLAFFYAGFLLGTLLCGVVETYALLLAARVFTGLFGGVIGSICFAIAADLFPPQVRGRVMGVVHTAFSASQVMGIPIGLFLANRFGWQGPFFMIAGVGTLVGVAILLRLRPMVGHLEEARKRHPVRHLLSTATNRRYMLGFAATMLMATGGFMLQPFASNFAVHNLGVDFAILPTIYMATGVVGIVAGPLVGRLTDQLGAFRLLACATFACAAIVWWWTGLGRVPLWVVICGNVALFATITSRMVSTNALISRVPAPHDRGAYMAVSSSMQQFAGAVSAWVSGVLVVQDATGRIENYRTLGWVVIAAMAVTLLQMRNVDRMVTESVANATRR